MLIAMVVNVIVRADLDGQLGKGHVDVDDGVVVAGRGGRGGYDVRKFRHGRADVEVDARSGGGECARASSGRGRSSLALSCVTGVALLAPLSPFSPVYHGCVPYLSVLDVVSTYWTFHSLDGRARTRTIAGRNICSSSNTGFFAP